MTLTRRTTLAALATPLLLTRPANAADRSINVGTYTGPQGEFIRRFVIPRFQTDFSCRVFQTEGVTLGQISVLRTQKANPRYSVMFMDDVGVPVARDEGLIDPLPIDKMPNLARLIPRFLLTDKHAAAFAVSVVAPFFNTAALSAVPTWELLWDPKYKSRFLLVTPKQTQSVQMLVAATALATGKSFNEAQYLVDQGWDKMAALKPNVQTVYDNNVTAVLQVSQGQADIGGPDFGKTVLPFAMKKAPVAMSAPREGVFGGVNTVTIVKNGPNPDLAAAFADRMLEPATQKALSEYTYAAPTVVGITLNAETAALVSYPESRMDDMKLMTVDWSVMNPKRGAIVEKFNSTFS